MYRWKRNLRGKIQLLCTNVLAVMAATASVTCYTAAKLYAAMMIKQRQQASSSILSSLKKRCWTQMIQLVIMRSDKPSLCTAHTNDNNNHDNGKEDATVNNIKKHDDDNNNEIYFLQYNESQNYHHPYVSVSYYYSKQYYWFPFYVQVRRCIWPSLILKGTMIIIIIY